MSHLSRTVAAFGLLLGAGTAVLAQEKIRIDADGNPLPERAICRLGSGKSVDSRDGQTTRIRCLAFSPDGKEVVTCPSFGTNASVCFWDAATGKALRKRDLSPGGVDRVLYAPDGKRLFVSGWMDQAEVRIWDAKDLKTLHGFSGHRFGGQLIAISADGKMLAGVCTLTSPAATIIWDAQTRAKLAEHPSLGRNSQQIVLLPSNRTLIYCNYNDIHFWEWETRRERTLSIPNGGIAISPDGLLIAVGGSSGTKLYDVNTGNEIWKASAGHKSPTPGHIAFAPNGRTIALSLGDGVVRLFDWAHDKQWSFKGANKGPYQLAFSSDGTRLAGVENTSALIWDVADVTSQPPPKHDDASPKDLDDWCNQLGSPNSGAAYQAVWKLVGARDSAVPKLKAMLTQADPAAYKQIGRWIANLNSEHFVVREKAAKELFTLGDAALAPIEEALKETLSLEQRRRLQAISKSLRDKSMAAERLKELRTIMALEQIGTPSARAAIEWLNHGLVTAWITQQARLALNRMDDRKSRER